MRLANSSALLVAIAFAAGALAQDAPGGVRLLVQSAPRSRGFVTTPPRRCGTSCAWAMRSASSASPTTRTIPMRSP
jgi:hypothetical protein